MSESPRDRAIFELQRLTSFGQEDCDRFVDAMLDAVDERAKQRLTAETPKEN